MTASMHTHSLCCSTILFHIRWELSLCCMWVNSSDWSTRRRVTLCKIVDTCHACHAWTQLWLPPSCVPVTTVLPQETPLLRTVLTDLSVLFPSHFHLSYGDSTAFVLHEAMVALTQYSPIENSGNFFCIDNFLQIQKGYFCCTIASCINHAGVLYLEITPIGGIIYCCCVPCFLSWALLRAATWMVLLIRVTLQVSSC